MKSALEERLTRIGYASADLSDDWQTHIDWLIDTVRELVAAEERGRRARDDEVKALRAQLDEAVDWLKKIRTGMYAVSSLDGFLADYDAVRAKEDK